MVRVHRLCWTKLLPAALALLLPETATAGDCIYSTGQGSSLTLTESRAGAVSGFDLHIGTHVQLCTLSRETALPYLEASAGWATAVDATCPSTGRAQFGFVNAAPDLPPAIAIFFDGNVFYPGANCTDDAKLSIVNLPSSTAIQKKSPTVDANGLRTFSVTTVHVTPMGTIDNSQ